MIDRIKRFSIIDEGSIRSLFLAQPMANNCIQDECLVNGRKSFSEASLVLRKDIFIFEPRIQSRVHNFHEELSRVREQGYTSVVIRVIFIAFAFV